jgi:serine/threonine protein kinase
MLYHELDMLQQLQTNGASSELVVPLHWAFQDQRMCYFVFDLVDGGDLRFHLNHRNHKMSEKVGTFSIHRTAPQAYPRLNVFVPCKLSPLTSLQSLP